MHPCTPRMTEFAWFYSNMANMKTDMRDVFTLDKGRIETSYPINVYSANDGEVLATIKKSCYMMIGVYIHPKTGTGGNCRVWLDGQIIAENVVESGKAFDYQVVLPYSLMYLPKNSTFRTTCFSQNYITGMYLFDEYLSH